MEDIYVDVSKIPQHVADILGATLWKGFQRFISVPGNKEWLDAEVEKMKGGTENGQQKRPRVSSD